MNSSKNVPLIKFLYYSRRRNIRRAWRLRKLNIQRRDDLCAMSRTMAVMNRQRGEAIQIAQEALSDGHRYPCYADERELAIRCRCGWRDENARLQKLKGEIDLIPHKKNYATSVK